MSKVEDIHKECLGAASAQTKRSLDVEKLKDHFGGLKRKLIRVIATCGNDALIRHETQVQVVCDEFDKIVQLLGSIHIGQFDRTLKDALEVARDALQPDSEAVDVDVIIKRLEVACVAKSM